MEDQVPLPEFNIFSPAPIQQSVYDGTYKETRPISVISSKSDLEFEFVTDISTYTQLSELLMYLKVQLVIDDEKSNVKLDTWTTNEIGTSNYLLHSMWDAVVLTIGNTQTTLILTTYPIRANFETLLGVKKNTKKSHLTSALWATEKRTDDKVKFEDDYIHKVFKPEATASDFRYSKIVELCGKLHLDLCNQSRALIGGMKVHLRFIPKNQDFYLHAKADSTLKFHLEIIDASLKVYTKRVSPSLLNAHLDVLNKYNAVYPITRCEVKSFIISSGLSDIILDNIVTGQLPRRIFVAFVKNKAFNGAKSENPFYFHHFNINYIACYFNGIMTPSKPYQPDFKNGLYLNEFTGLFQAANQLYSDSTIDISRDTYAKGNTIFGFNFSPDNSDDFETTGYRQPPVRGSLRLEIHFDEPTSEAINCLVYCEFDNNIYITKDRNVLMDYP
jgi:hypothetical protein